MSKDNELALGIVEKADLIVCDDCECEADVSTLELFQLVECPRCGAEIKIPGTLGPYLVFDVLGSGGMGAVFDAYDTALNRSVAIKVLKPALLEDPESFSSFKFEAQAVARLNHQNIAQIYTFFDAKTSPCIVMERVTGGSLDDMMKARGPLDPGLVMAIGLDIARALDTAAEINIVHGDVKPQNILLDSNMLAKLVDFGLASVDGVGQVEGIWGTPYYISPESITEKRTDMRSDIYSLGATLYHAIAGHPPFDGDGPKETALMRIDTKPPLLSDSARAVTPQLDDIIDRMMNPVPMRRYPTYKSLIGDLAKVATSGPKGGPRVSIPKRTRSATQKVSPRDRGDADGSSSSRNRRKNRRKKR